MASQFSQRLGGLFHAVVSDVAKEMYGAGELVAVTAQISITEGAVSGKHHVPSAPGTPPNADSHHLADGIIVVQPSPLHVRIISTAAYSAYQEFGSSRAAARPFMGPAAIQSRPEIERRLSGAVDRAVRRHMRR